MLPRYTRRQVQGFLSDLGLEFTPQNIDQYFWYDANGLWIPKELDGPVYIQTLREPKTLFAKIG